MAKHLVHPYEDLTEGQWLKVNLHAHTTMSDGKCTRQQVVDDYADRGYDALMVADHDVTTLVEDYMKLDSRGLLLIPGNEISANGQHLLHVNGTIPIRPIPQRQTVIDNASKEDDFVIVNHPNFGDNFDHCPMRLLRQWTGYVGIEIYNGIVNLATGNPYATDKWDMLLSEGRRIWGLANDDSHSPETIGTGWNEVFARQRTAEDVLEAILAGRFYATTGIAITDIAVEDMTVTIRTDAADHIVASGMLGRQIASVNDAQITVDVPETGIYVRFTCYGPHNTRAWTQPFFVEGHTRK